jgi:23S rRNA (uracil1939-C5)-methyltransferase
MVGAGTSRGVAALVRRRGAIAGGRTGTRTGRGEVHAEAVGNVRIDAIAAGGDGVGHLDGLACFVPRTAAGDVVQIAYTTHARYARGRVLQVLEASADRVEPRCRHFAADRCGGCQLQHLTDEAQRTARQQIVRDTLQRVGRREIELPALVSGDVWEYRDRLTLALRLRGSQWIGGLHAFDDPSRVFALEECPISHPRLLSAWRDVRRVLRGLPTPATGETLRLSLRLQGPNDTRVALVVLGARRWPEAERWAASVREAAPDIGAVWWEPVDAQARWLSGDAEPDVLAFAQVNHVMASALRAHVEACIIARSPLTVVDAYAGRGELGAVLAARGIAVTCIESDARATGRATELLKPFPSAQVLTGLVEACLPAVLPADVVVLNPPRRGVDVRVAAALGATRGIRAIVYVSCDPATLARDVSRMPGWRIESLRCFDMFPQTAHVESVCVLTPEAT